MLSIPMPPTATPQHRAMKAWLVGAVLNALKRTREAERVSEGRYSAAVGVAVWCVSLATIQFVRVSVIVCVCVRACGRVSLCTYTCECVFVTSMSTT